MLNKSRRDFIKYSSFLMLGTAFHTSVFASNEMEVIKAKAELIKVLEQWQKDELVSPEAYLDNKGIIGMDKASLAVCNGNDFKCGNTFKVEGLVISKTEAAVLAQMAVMLF